MEACRVLGKGREGKASAFVYAKKPGGKGEKGRRKAAAEVWGPEMRGSPQRRDVAGLVFTGLRDTGRCGFVHQHLHVYHGLPQ